MIRTATEHDLVSIRGLIKSVPDFWHEEWRSDALERAIHASDGLTFVWEEAGNILGFSCAQDVGFLGYLSLLVVAESARRKGIGRELIIHTEQELVKRGCVNLISDVWQDSVEFYKALGWSAPRAVLLRHRLGIAPRSSSS
jgi:GNAT superfamily N-acetyltransferase